MPGVLPSETWSMRLVMPAQLAPGECRRKYKFKVISNDASHDGVVSPTKLKVQGSNPD